MSENNMHTSPKSVLEKPKRIDDVRASHERRLALASVGLPAILILFAVLFSILLPHTYFSTSNLQTIISTQAVLGTIAVALVLPLACGEFDLSLAANLGLAAILVPGLTAKAGLSVPVAVLIAVAASTLIGVINGVLIAFVGINCLVATLAVGTLVTGGVQWYSNGNIIYDHIPGDLKNIAQNDVFGVPLPGIYLLVIAVLAWYALEHTPAGRYLYAVGGSKEASRLSGIRVGAVTLGAFTGAGLIAGVAGVVQASLLNAGNPNVGPPFLLPAFAAVFLGATTIKLGVFNVRGTVIAVFTLAAGITGLQLLGAPFYIAPIFQGGALLIAVIAVRVLRKEAI